MLHRLQTCCVLLCLLMASAVTGAQQRPQPPLVLPFISGPHGVIQIRVQLNDQINGLFGVDTGAMTSVLNENLIPRLGLKPDPIPRKPAKPDPDLPPNLQLVTLAHFQCGALSVQHLQLRSAPGQTLAGVAGQELAGLLGADVLSRYAVLIDFQQHQLLLWKGGHLSAAQRAAAGMRDAQFLPLTQEEDYHAPAVLRDPPKRWYNEVAIKVNAAPARPFTVDTGSDVTIVPTDLAHKLGLHSIRTEQDQIGFDDGPITTEVAVANSLTLGNFRLRHPVVDYATNEDDTDAILGRDLLSQLRLLLDYPAGRAYFQPRKRQAVSLPFAVAGLNVPLITARLKDGKPALFGFEPAMETSVDGRVVAARHLYVPSALAHGDLSLVSSLCLGGNALCLDDVTLQIADFTAQRAGALSPLDGFLGADLLDQYAVRLDFTRRTVEMISPGHLEGSSSLSPSAQRLPLFLTEQGYVVEGLVDGAPTRFIVSLTTSRTTLLSRALIAELNPLATLTEARQAFQTRQLRLHKIEIGNASWNTPVVLDNSLQTASDTAQAEPLNWLGIDFLSRFHVVLDYAASALYLEPDPHYTNSSREEVGIGFVPTMDANSRMFINALDIPSPASEAGLRIGDEVLAVNGRVVRQTPLVKLLPEVKKPAGAAVTLTIRPRGTQKKRYVTLKIRKLI